MDLTQRFYLTSLEEGRPARVAARRAAPGLSHIPVGWDAGKRPGPGFVPGGTNEQPSLMSK
jgi:hypothetical protein